MHFGIEVVPFGEYSNPRKVMELALAAEAAGWEGYLAVGPPALSVWRRRPLGDAGGSRRRDGTHQALHGRGGAPALQAAGACAHPRLGLDILSQGRMIFGAGAGVDFDFAPFGEAADARTRGGDARRRARSGGRAGRRRARDLSRPLLPGGSSPTCTVVRPTAAHSDLDRRRQQGGLPACRRWDGWIIGTIDEQQNITLPPAQLAARGGGHHRPAQQPGNV